MCIRFFGDKILLQIALAFVGFVAAFFALESKAESWVVGVGSPWNLHWFYYFGIMLLGAELAKRNFFDKAVFAETRLSKLFFSAAVFAGTIVFYYAMRGGFEIFKLWKLQFIAPFALPMVCVSGIAFCRVFSGYFSKFFEGSSYSAISFVSNRTLEIYLVHGIGLSLCASLFFPGNLVAALAITLVSASCLKIASGMLSRPLRNLPFLRNN